MINDPKLIQKVIKEIDKVTKQELNEAIREINKFYKKKDKTMYRVYLKGQRGYKEPKYFTTYEEAQNYAENSQQRFLIIRHDKDTNTDEIIDMSHRRRNDDDLER